MAILVEDLIVDDEFQFLLPQMEQSDFNELERSIELEGFREPLIAWKGHRILVDGYNRREIWLDKHQGNPSRRPQVTEMEFADRDAVKEWIIRNQLARRNLTNAQRAYMALALKPFLEKQAKENQSAAGGDKAKALVPNLAKAPKSNTREKIAAAAGVAGETVRKVEAVINSGDEELRTAMLAPKSSPKHKSIDAAHNELKARKIPESRLTEDDIKSVRSNAIEIADRAIAELKAIRINDPECEAAFNLVRGYMEVGAWDTLKNIKPSFSSDSDFEHKDKGWEPSSFPNAGRMYGGYSDDRKEWVIIESAPSGSHIRYAHLKDGKMSRQDGWVQIGTNTIDDAFILFEWPSPDLFNWVEGDICLKHNPFPSLIPWEYSDDALTCYGDEYTGFHCSISSDEIKHLRSTYDEMDDRTKNAVSMLCFTLFDMPKESMVRAICEILRWNREDCDRAKVQDTQAIATPKTKKPKPKPAAKSQPVPTKVLNAKSKAKWSAYFEGIRKSLFQSQEFEIDIPVNELHAESGTDLLLTEISKQRFWQKANGQTVSEIAAEKGIEIDLDASEDGDVRSIVLSLDDSRRETLQRIIDDGAPAETT